jgi:hypothetical protein
VILRGDRSGDVPGTNAHPRCGVDGGDYQVIFIAPASVASVHALHPREGAAGDALDRAA